MNKAAILTAFFLTSTLVSGATPAPTRTKMKRFIIQVGLAEYGTNRKLVSKWRQPPALSVFGANPAEKALVEEAVNTINPCLKSVSCEIQMLPDNTPGATLKVYFAPQRHFSPIGRENGESFTTDLTAYYWVRWKGQRMLTSALVLFANDKLSGDALRHAVYEKLIGALGLASDSDEVPESIFYARGSDHGTAPRPTELDLKVLSWFYQYAVPGDTRQDLSAKFEATWPK